MLELINRDRSTAGLAPVQLDDLASQVAQMHAEEMAANGYMSHWNLKGLGPDLRYSLAGGRDSSRENVYMAWNRYSTGTPVPIQDWNQEVNRAETSWMNSPGHRDNILSPEHTHVGIGIAYNTATGDIRMAQEFINHYVELDALPQSIRSAGILVVSGHALQGVSNPLIDIAYELAPRPMSVAELNATGSYVSPAKFLRAVSAPLDSQSRFRVPVPLDTNTIAGIYHIQIWVTVQATSVLAGDVVVWVGTVPP